MDFEDKEELEKRKLIPSNKTERNREDGKFYIEIMGSEIAHYYFISWISKEELKKIPNWNIQLFNKRDDAVKKMWEGIKKRIKIYNSPEMKSKRAKQYYQDYKKKWNKYSREYRKKNRAKILRNCKKHYYKYREEILRKKRDYYKKHRVEILKRQNLRRRKK